MRLVIDLDAGSVTRQTTSGDQLMPLDSAQAFEAISEAWLRCGWDTKHVYSFTWLGRPIIQLPEDMFRLQEVIYRIRPAVLIETGVAHGGSLVFYAGLFKAMGRGRVIGVDIEIRAHNREAIEAHALAPMIDLIESDSTSPAALARVRERVAGEQPVMVVLDSNHSKAHVLAELRAYAPFVSVDSYIVATDGIMQSLAGAPRSNPDWTWNNPVAAVREFLAENPDFVQAEPAFAFNEGRVASRVTYWPSAYLRRVRQ